MTDTPVLSLPLLAPAQSQKHVTVNEALSRLDAMTQLDLVSISRTAPPPVVEDGDVYHVAASASDGWSGQDGQLAVALNGGWVFVPPRRGWRAFVKDLSQTAIFDGQNWRIGAATLSPFGAGIAMQSVEVDVDVVPGTTVLSPDIFPSRSIMLGVTGRVVEALTGTLAAWDLGLPAEPGRYGTGLGTAVNSWVNGPGNPEVSWSATPLQLTATGGDFAGGRVRLAAHFLELSLPDAI